MKHYKDMREYNEDFMEFSERHGFEWQGYTSPMTEDGRYYKTYKFNDGAIWEEINLPFFRKSGKTDYMGRLHSIIEERWATEVYDTDNSYSRILETVVSWKWAD